MTVSPIEMGLGYDYDVSPISKTADVISLTINVEGGLKIICKLGGGQT